MITNKILDVPEYLSVPLVSIGGDFGELGAVFLVYGSRLGVEDEGDGEEALQESG